MPDLQTVHLAISAEEKQPVLLYAVIALLLLLLMFVLGYLVSSQLLTDDAVQLTPVEQTTPAEEVEPVVSVKADKPEAEPPLIQQGVQQPLQAPEEDAQTVSSLPVEAAAIRRAVTETGDPDLMNIPYLHELPEYQQQSIPAMNFAGHVYSSDASSRSVIINGMAMSEGDSLMPSLSVEFITLNGVVFRYQEILFRIDILQDWSIE